VKKNVAQIVVVMLAVVFSIPSGAVLITYDSVLDGDGVSTTAVAGATVVNFNDATCGAYLACTGDLLFATGDLAGRYAAPYIAATGLNDTTVYVSTAQQSGSATFDLGATANYFGLLWGSIDDYNTISFLNGGSEVASFTGTDIAEPANGNQTAPSTNTYVNFFYLPTFDGVLFSSTNWAFESDNHAWATVPEPGTLGLLGAGLIGLAWRRRRAA